MAGEIPESYQRYLQELATAQLNKLSGGGGGGQNTQGTSDSWQRGGSYHSMPGVAGQSAGALNNVIGQQAQGYSQFVDNPTASPAYQNALSGMLQALHPGEREGQRDLADAYRAAGNTASSSYGESLNKYQQGVDRNRASVASDLLAKLYPSIAAAKFAPLSQSPALINALKLDQTASETHQQNSSTPDKTGGGSMVSLGGGTGAPATSGFGAPPSLMQLLNPGGTGGTVPPIKKNNGLNTAFNAGY